MAGNNENFTNGIDQGPRFFSFQGRITGIQNFKMDSRDHQGCTQIMAVVNGVGNQVNFITSQNTYFIDRDKVREGDLIIGFYDGNAPAPLIYPPQYRALVIGRSDPGINIKVDWFDRNLISTDGMLKLNISPETETELENGQDFIGNVAERYLTVLYGASTRSIPALTTPDKIIVMC